MKGMHQARKGLVKENNPQKMERKFTKSPFSAGQIGDQPTCESSKENGGWDKDECFPARFYPTHPQIPSGYVSPLISFRISWMRNRALSAVATSFRNHLLVELCLTSSRTNFRLLKTLLFREVFDRSFFWIFSSALLLWYTAPSGLSVGLFYLVIFISDKVISLPGG